jgi:hypothetical protein
MKDIQHPAVSGARNGSATVTWLQQYLKLPSITTVREFAILFIVTIFLLLYGLVPIFGGDQLGLVGADEPRYAQVAGRCLPHTPRPATMLTLRWSLAAFG